MTRNRGLDVDCQDVVELATRYLDGVLDDESRATVEAHLASCEGCAAYLDQLRATRARLGKLGGAKLPATLEQSLLAAFRDLSR